MKDILCSEPLLQYPDFKKRFTVTCDASSTGIGSVLSRGTLGHDLPVAYSSRVLTTAHRNYFTVERELTALFGVARNLFSTSGAGNLRLSPTTSR